MLETGFLSLHQTVILGAGGGGPMVVHKAHRMLLGTQLGDEGKRWGLAGLHLSGAS